MISTPDRTRAVELINDAVEAGARKFMACRELGLSIRTLQRWTREGGVKADGRPEAARPAPRHKLTPGERAEVLDVANSPAHKSKRLKNLFYTGQYTHPGIGVPMTLISSHLVHEEIRDAFN